MRFKPLDLGALCYSSLTFNEYIHPCSFKICHLVIIIDTQLSEAQIPGFLPWGRGEGNQQNLFLPGMTSVKLSKQLKVIFPASTLFIYMRDLRLPCNFSTKWYARAVLPLLEDIDFC